MLKRQTDNAAHERTVACLLYAPRQSMNNFKPTSMTDQAASRLAPKRGVYACEAETCEPALVTPAGRGDFKEGR